MSESIGIIDLKMNGWSAGHSYALGLAMSLHAAGANVRFISKDKDPSALKVPAIAFPPEYYFPGEWTFRKLFGVGRKNMLNTVARQEKLSVLGPVLMAEQLTPGRRNIGWIPDLQPLVLKDIYSPLEVQKSERRFRKLLQHCERVIVSSEDSGNVVASFFPENKDKLAVLPFPSLFAFKDPAPPVGDIRKKYDIPEKFLLVANQFWTHKNHIQVIRALAKLRRRGIKICCVMTGLPADFRDRDNTVLSELFQEIASGGISDQCRVLGLVPKQDLVDLLGCATALVQPSRFEGWNTTVQDALALGCPVIVSDLPVHREQAPAAAGFFTLDDVDALAEVMAAQIEVLASRPDPSSQTGALEAQRIFAAEHGRKARAIFEGNAA